jgi:hypothetical protein
MDMKLISLLPDDILWNIFSFDRRFVFRNNNGFIIIGKIAKDDFRYVILQKRIIITKEYRHNPDLYGNNRIVLKQHKNVSSMIIHDNHYISDIEFSHYLYKTIQMYRYF